MNTSETTILYQSMLADTLLSSYTKGPVIPYTLGVARPLPSTFLPDQLCRLHI